MKKLLLILFDFSCYQLTVFSQPCLPEGIIFTTQLEIDNFQTNNPNCTEIEGWVTIDSDDITNLNGLSVVTSIGGDLYISENATLTSLTGLDNLTSIGGDLHIYQNEALTSLTALDNVTYIVGYIVIGSNAALTSLTGLDNVTSIGGRLYISYNDALTSISGLDNVTSIGGDLIIDNNDALTSLTGLDNVTSIGESLSIGWNAALTSLTGLDNVTSIGEILIIDSNPALTSLTALDNVTSIWGDLFIYGNNALTSLTGLDNIDASSISNLRISDNVSLSTCEVQSICDYLASPGGNIEINGNATGCNNQTEVEAACASSVEDINHNSHISIFPNPAKDILTISCKNGEKIEEVVVYNQMGQKVFEEELSNNTINVSSLQKGLYIVELISKEWKLRKKLIIE